MQVFLCFLFCFWGYLVLLGLKQSPCLCLLYPAEMALNRSLDFQHFLAKHESASLCTLHMTDWNCMKVSQSSWRKLSDRCVYYTVICRSPEKHVASHVAVHAQNTHCVQPLVNMKCCSQHIKSIMYVIIEVTGIHVDVNSVYFWGKHNINWEKKNWSETFCPLGIDWMIKSVLQTWINVCNSQAAIFLFVDSMQ